MLIKQQGSGSRWYLGGDKKTIQELHLSAYNWGAVDGDSLPGLYNQYPEIWAFTITLNALLKWRAAIAELSYDADKDFETPTMKGLLKKRAEEWFGQIPKGKIV